MTTISAPSSTTAPRTTTRAPRTLADLLPNTKARTVVLVVAFALFTALTAQFQIHLSWTPVPITGQTFAVLLSGAVLGWGAGAASQILYVAMGTFGLPFFAQGTHGWNVVKGASGGYLVGFIFAAALVGLLAEHSEDRKFLTSIPAMLAGTAVIYLFGVAWLAHSLGISAEKAIELGLAPFVIGDAIKLLAAGIVMPAAWRFARK